MKYNKNIDNNSRYIRFDIGSSNLSFSVSGAWTFEFPAPNYMYQLSNDEIEEFAHNLNRKWQFDFEDVVKIVLSKCHENSPNQTAGKKEE
jgi:hypothetical protein